MEFLIGHTDGLEHREFLCAQMDVGGDRIEDIRDANERDDCNEAIHEDCGEQDEVICHFTNGANIESIHLAIGVFGSIHAFDQIGRDACCSVARICEEVVAVFVKI